MRKSFLFLLILMIALLSGKIQAQTNVSGMISSNTVWTLSGSPYNVVGGVLVKEGITLTIEAGVNVQVAAGLAIQVDGTLLARGTSSSVITFTKNGTGNWGYLLFSDKSTDATYDIDGNYTGGSILEYCTIEYSGGLSISDNGALRLNAAHPFINYSIIRNNTSTGIRSYNLTGILKIMNSSISYNSSSNHGGGILISSLSGTCVIKKNTISNNTSAGDGGGLHCTTSSSTIELSGNSILNNGAYHGAGAVIVGYGNFTVADNEIMNNSSSGEGGALHCGGYAYTATISGNNISGNSSIKSGGGIYQSGGSLVINHNLIIRNSSGSDGGGINRYGGSLRVTDNYIIENSATGNGGGISATNADMDILNNIIALNRSSGIGGGIIGNWDELKYNLLYKNTAQNGGALYQFIYISPWKGITANGIIQLNSIIQNNATTSTLPYSIRVESPLSMNFNNFNNKECLFEFYNNNVQGSANLDMKYNWWGTPDDQAIQSRIYDWLDDATKGIVDYQPYEIAPRTDAPVSPPSNVLINGSTLTWSANPEGDIAGYRIYWDTDAGFPYANSINTGKVTSYNIQSIPPGAYIALTAYDSGYNTANDDLNTITNENQTNGNESWYSEASQTPPAVPVLSTPANGSIDLSITPTLKWRKSSSAVSYNLQVSTNSDFVSGIVFDQVVNDTLKLITGLANNTEYFWRVSATNEGASSQYSPAWSFRTVIIYASIGSVSGTTPLCIGGTATYTANSVVLAGGTGAWSSSNTAIASVSSSGLVTGVGAGDCNIIYTITGGTGGTVFAQKSLTISPNASISSVTGASSLCAGGTTTFIANSVVLGGGTGTWSSSNSSIATVNSSGLVTGITAGDCNIIYTITNGCGGTISSQKALTVYPGAGIGSVTGTSPLCVGDASNYIVNNVVLGGGTGAWSTSNPSTATVNSSGLVTGVSAGTCNIVYTISGGCGGTISRQQEVIINPVASIGSVTGTTPLCTSLTTTYTANSVILSGGAGNWSSSNTGIAIVNSSGIVTGISAGTCNIIYTITGGCGGTVSSQQSITIIQGPSISSVTGSSPLCVGESANYTADNLVLGTGTGAWSSSNPLIATVNSSGQVTGVSSGTCNIIYTITGGCTGTIVRQQSVTINPVASVSSVTGLSSFCEAETPSYTANAVVLSGGTGAWSSSNTNIAYVDPVGVVTAYSGGTCDIIYTISGGCGGTVSAKKSVTINPLASASSISASNPLCVGGIATYTVENLVLSGGTGSWSSDNHSIATINSSGVANGIGAGSCYITYTITGGCGGTTYAVQLIDVSPPASISSVTGTSPLCISSSTTYSANNVIFSGGSGTWSSSNTSVATVSQSGSVQGISAGTCNIIYTITGGCGGTVSSQKSITIVQNPSITSVTGTTPLCVGGTATYNANNVVSGGGSGSWSSSNPSIANVTSSGFVTAVSAGTCNIIYTINGSCAGSIYKQQSLTVNPAPGIASVSGASPLCVNGTATYTANSVVLSGGTGSWSSSNTTIATVSSSGLVTAKAAGTCNILYTITGSSCGSTVSAQASVIVNSVPAITSTSPATSCGPGILTIGAVPSAGTINWYQTQSSATLLATGTSYTTPLLSSTTTYYAEAVNGNCVSSPRTAITCNIYEVQVPVITKKWNDVLVCSNPSNIIIGYQWLNGSVPIPGATLQYYVTGKTPGQYKVEITDQNGCKVASQVMEIAGQSYGFISVYPNPASESVAVSFSSEITGRVVMTVLSETGTKAKEISGYKDEEDFLGYIPVDDLDEGIYIVRVSVNQIFLHVSKVVVIK